MNSSGEIRYFEAVPRRRRRPIREYAGYVAVAAISVGGGLLYARDKESRQSDRATQSSEAPNTTKAITLTPETEGIQTLYICTIKNPDGSATTVEVNINGPEDAVEIAKILAGQTGNVAGILLDGVNLANAQLGSDFAVVIGNDLDVLKLSDGIGASAPNDTEKWYLKYSTVTAFVHDDMETPAISTALAP